MMNKICIITDTHFGFEKNNNDVLKSCMKFFDDVLIPYLTKNKIKNLFILGDLFDSRTTISTKIHDKVFELFDVKLKKFNIYILVGNHDILYNSTLNVHSLKFLRKFKNVTVIEKPQIIEINKKNILMTPWVVDNSPVDNIIEDECDILMGHFDIKGFNFSKHVICKEGYEPESFNKFKFVFSGHFHTRSVKKVNNTTFVYVGSPYQLTRVDSEEERGFLIYDTEKETYSFECNDVSSKFVEIEYPNEFTELDVKNNRVDVFIEYNEKNYDPEKYEEYLNSIEILKPAKITPFYSNSELNTNFDIKKCNMSSIPDLMNNYVDDMEIDNNDKECVNDILSRVYDTVTGAD
jgi:DNA repair exonuclease SbcCD nuclease subunit